MNAQGSQIARAEKPELESIFTLLSAQLEEHQIQPSENLRATIEEILADDRHGFILVARQSGQAVGVAYVSTIMSIEHGGKSVWLEEVYVLPEFREQGVGTALVQAALTHARDGGYRAVDLEVDLTHERAANLYERLGFSRMSRTRYVMKLKQ